MLNVYVFLVWQALRERYIIKITYTKNYNLFSCLTTFRLNPYGTWKYGRKNKKIFLSQSSNSIFLLCVQKKKINEANTTYFSCETDFNNRFLQCLLISYFIVVTILFRCNEGVFEINPTLCYPRRRILWLPWRCASSSAFRLFYRSLRSWHSSGSSRWLRHRCCTPTRGQWSWRCPENRVSAANKLPVRPTRNRILAITCESVFLINNWNIAKNTMFQAHLSDSYLYTHLSLAINPRNLHEISWSLSSRLLSVVHKENVRQR